MLLVLFILNTLFSQEKQKNERLLKIDSLKKVLKKTERKENFFLLEKITKNFSFENLDSSLSYNKRMITVASYLKNDSLIIYSKNLEGDIYHDKEDYSESILSYNKALELNTSYKGLKAYSYNGLANNYTKLENFEKATEIYLKTLDEFIAVKDTFMIIGTQLHLANNFRKLKDFNSSEKYYKKAVDFNNSKNKLLENFLFNNLSDLYNDMEKPHLSLENSNKSEAFFKEKKIEKYEAYSTYNKAVSYSKLNKNLLAEKNFLKAIGIHEKFNNNYELANSFTSLSKFYVKIKNFDNAINAASKAIEYSENIKAIEFQIEANKYYAEALVGKNLHKESIPYFKVQDSLNNQFYENNKLKITKNLSEQYQTEKKEKELLKTKAEKATTELALNKQKQLSYGLFGGLAILLLIGFSVFQRNKRKHQLAISQEKENNLQAVISAEEKERTRIARELHDGIVQQIGAVIINSRNNLSKLGLAEKPESQELLTRLEDSNKELRNISHQMMPRALEEKGLITALQELLATSLQPANIKFGFEFSNISERLPKKVEVTLYRITQELINNIIKHSKASLVNVQLLKIETAIIFMVEDNGKGFSSTQKTGLGLQNIKSRIDIIKGSVNFNSENTGTLTTIKIPL